MNLIERSKNQVQEKGVVLGYEMKLNNDVQLELMRIMEALKARGVRGLLVGGSVRDMVIASEFGGEFKPKDFDIEVYGLTDDQLVNFLTEYYGEERVDLVGRAFGVIKVRMEGWDEPLDFSMPRTDSKVAEGHIGFVINGQPDMSIEEAARRRDITINSMAYDLMTGELFDYFGGVEDVRSRIIRATDEERFEDDPLRVIRVMQFTARFEFEVEKETAELCKKVVKSDEFLTLSSERVTEEFAKFLLKAKRPSVGLNFAHEVGMVRRLWPDLAAVIGVPQNRKWHPEGDVWVHTLQVLDAMSDVVRHLRGVDGLINSEDLTGMMGDFVGCRLGHWQKFFSEKEQARFEDFVIWRKKEWAKKFKQYEDEQALTLLFSALTHDFGKAIRTRVDFDKGIVSDGHEPAGEGPVRRFLNSFNKNRVSERMKQEVVGLVVSHMRPHPIWENALAGMYTKRAIWRLGRKLSSEYGTSLNKLLYLVLADKSGRNPEGRSFTLEQMREMGHMDWFDWWQEQPKQVIESRKSLFKGEEIIAALVGAKLISKGSGAYVGVIQKALDDGMGELGLADVPEMFRFYQVLGGGNWVNLKKREDLVEVFVQNRN